MSDHTTLTDTERADLAAWWESDWPSDGADVLDTLAAVVESIVAARVAAARAEHVIPNRRGDTTVREWTPEDGDLRCQKCGHPNVVWFTDATTWNSAMGNEGGVLCIRCFIGTYESQGEPVIWSLWREHPGAFSEFSRGLEAGRTSVGRFMAEARADERARLVAEIEALPSRRIWPNRPSGSDSGFADGYSSAMADLRALIEGADGG